MHDQETAVTRDDVLIERVDERDGYAADLWRVTSADCSDDVVVGKPAAIDAALGRIAGKRGQLYIRNGDDAELEPFNPAGA